ncbi:MAG: flagellar biosynthetic protein FliR [Pseudomonadota bacterium]
MLANLSVDLGQFFLIFARIAAFMAVAPLVSEGVISAKIKIVTAIALSFWLLQSQDQISVVPDFFMVRVIGEMCIGLAVGLLIRCFFFSLHISGAIIAQTTSLALFGSFNTPEPSPAIGQMLITGGLAILATSDLHYSVAEVFLVSVSGPQGLFAISSEGLLSSVAYVFDEIMAFSLLVCGPFILVALIYNLLLGIISRSMPQLMVTLIGAPAISLGTILLVWNFGPTLIAVWLEFFVSNVNINE